MDLAIIGTAFSHLKTSMDIAKLISDSTSSLGEAETKLKLAELISSLADLKIELADIKVNLIEKDDEIRLLKEKNLLNFDGKLYWKEGDSTPFCPICFETENKFIHLTYNEGYEGTVEDEMQDAYHHCKFCGNSFH